MKVLSIGNSFSQDAQRWLHQCAASAGVELTCVNLCIGGCPIVRHWQNVPSNEPTYEYEVNGEYVRHATLMETLREEAWDVVTVQQVSGQSGRPQSFLPELPWLAEVIRRECPTAKLWLQQTWCYASYATHPDFPAYNCNSDEMHRRVRDGYEMASKLVDAPLIPTGNSVQALRPRFERLLYRDGFHLSPTYGRYVAAVTWLATLCGVDPSAVTFVPAEGEETVDEAILAEMKAIVSETLKA